MTKMTKHDKAAEVRPLILITNDDGIHAKGIGELKELVRPLGDVWVVAPNGPRSAQSSAITVELPIWSKVVHEEEGLVEIACSGTPTDCVKLAIDQLLPRRPDLLLSGINHGSNASINVIYSGTMGAAMEGSLHGVPSIGLSLCSHKADADFSDALPFFLPIIEETLRAGLPDGVSLNVNAPLGAIKGCRVAKQAHGRWANEFEKHDAPRPLDYYWLIGDFNSVDKDDSETDQWALDHGYISIVPIHTDMTHSESMKHLRNSFSAFLEK